MTTARLNVTGGRGAEDGPSPLCPLENTFYFRAIGPNLLWIERAALSPGAIHNPKG
jgi:hypothetical protein